MEQQSVADGGILGLGEAQAYQALCAFGSWALLTDVQEGDIEGLAEGRAMFFEPPFSQVAVDDARQLGEWLADADEAGGIGSLAREAHLDRTFLFYMVGQSRTSPYESVYRTDDATLFGPTTLQVRERYAECGLVFEDNGKSPDDHLGLELAFLAELLQRAAQSAELGKGEEQERALAQAKAFLSEHVLVFAFVYLANLKKQAQTPFYRSVAGIVASTLERLADVLDARAAEGVDEERFLL